MTLIKSSIPLTVYHAESPLLANITGDAIRRFAFRSIDNVSEEKACGFVNCDDMFDTEWINSIPEKGHYMAFGFRVDVRRIAPAILKKHVAAKVREEIENLQTQGKKALSKGRKGEIREHCKNMLLSKTEPRPSMYGVAVNMSTGLVYIASTSKSVLELFEKCMESAFGGELERLYPIALSGTTGGSDHPLEDLMKDIYAESMTLSLDEKTYSIAEQGKATLSRTDGPSVSVTDAPDSARAGLESGLLLTSLKIRLSSMPEDELVSVFTLNADFSFSGLKTPRIRRQKGEDADPDTDFLLKMGFIEETVTTMHSLFRQHAGN